MLSALFVAGKLGANAILGVSLAVCKAGAAQKVFNWWLSMTYCILTRKYNWCVAIMFSRFLPKKSSVFV